MRRTRATAGVTGAVLIGFACALVPSPASAADLSQEALIRMSQAAGRTVSVEAARQADLVGEEDQRLIDAQLAGQATGKRPALDHPYRSRTAGFNTLVLTARRATYTLDDLRRLAPETLLPQPKGGYLLREHVLVGPGATLTISPRRPLVIRMSSGPEGFVSLVTQGGRLRLNGSAAAPITFQSWDESHGRQDTKLADGRAYVRASGQFVAEHTTFSRLGFWSGRTGGVSVVGSGASLGKDADAGARADVKAGREPVVREGAGQTEVLPAGKLPSAAQDPASSFASRIVDATMTGNAFGLFVTGSSGPTISRTTIRKSLVDGLVLHGDVNSASISDVTVERSGSDGVAVSREVEGAVLTRLVVRQNGGDGIVLAGRPLARGPSASGASIRQFGNNTVTSSKSSGNLRIGIHVIGGTAIRVQGNSVTGGKAGIVVSDGAVDVDVDSNQVAGAATNGIQVRDSREVRVTGNVVRDSATGVHVRNSSALIRQNSTSGVTLHGITFVGRVAGSSAEKNLLAGSGTTAIDVVRTVDPKAPSLEQNDLSGWSRTVTSDSLVSVLLHPLTVIWMLVALMLLAMSRPRRGGTGLPYRGDPLARRANVVLPPMPPAPAMAAPAAAVAPPTAPEIEGPVPVFTVPERRVPVPVAAPATVQVHVPVPSARFTRPDPAPARAAGPEPAPRPLPQPVTASASSSTSASGSAEHDPDLVLTSMPVRGPGQPGAARAGHAVIDLAIREARLNPAAPRRRRVSGR